MTTQEFENRARKYNNELSQQWKEIVKDVNDYLMDNENPGIKDWSEHHKLIENFALQAAWIHDRLTGKNGVPGHRKYRGSMTKKIRRILGYSI